MYNNYYSIFREMVDAATIFFDNEDRYSQYEDDWYAYEDILVIRNDDDQGVNDNNNNNNNNYYYYYYGDANKGSNGDIDDYSELFWRNDGRWQTYDNLLAVRSLTSSADADSNAGDDNLDVDGDDDDDNLDADTEGEEGGDDTAGDDNLEEEEEEEEEEEGGDDYDVVGNDSVPTSAPTVGPTSAPTIPPSALPTSMPSSGPYLHSQGSAMMQGDMVWALAAGVGFVSIVGVLLVYALNKHWKGLSNRLASRPGGARGAATKGLKQASGNDYYWNVEMEMVGEETRNILQADFTTTDDVATPTSEPGERGHLVETDLEAELGRYGRYCRSTS